MVRVFIPASLHKFTNGEKIIVIEAKTIRDVIDSLDQRFPGIHGRLCDGDRLKPEIAVAVDTRVSTDGLLEQLSDDCEVHFVSTVSGG